jgi:hypothetical protein
MGSYGYNNGDFDALIAPIDEKHMMCGVKNDASNDFSDFKFLYFPGLGLDSSVKEVKGEKTKVEHKVVLSDSYTSSFLDEAKYPGTNGVDGKMDTIVATEAYEQEFWAAEFDERYINSLKITAPPLDADCIDNALAGAQVDVDDNTCGIMPATVTAGETYTIFCPYPLLGTSLFIST